VSSLRPVSGSAEEILALLREWDAAPDPEPLVIATSGSTGQPKRVVLSRAAMRASALATQERLGGPGQWVLNLPPSYVAGVQVLYRSVVAGTSPAYDVEGVTGPRSYVSLVPTQLVRALAGDVAPLTRFDAVLVGGGPLAPDVRREAEGRGITIVQTYGMSETCGGCVYDGQPLDGVQVAVGGDGRIRISGPVLFSGYRRRPDLTAAATDGRWFVTSVLVSVDMKVRLTVRGRADGMIFSGGENVAADEVAAVLAGCPGVREAAVVGCPDPEWGELVTAVVVAQDPDRPPELAALREAVRAVLPAAAAPRALVLVAALPLLASGKPDRLAMTALAARQMNGTDPGNR